MNENIGKTAFSSRIQSKQTENRGAAVLGSAMNEAAALIKEETPIVKKDLPKKEKQSEHLTSADEFGDKENLKKNPLEKGEITLNETKNSSMVYDMDVYLTLSELKRMKGLPIHKYCNEAIRKQLSKDYPDFLNKFKGSRKKDCD